MGYVEPSPQQLQAFSATADDDLPMDRPPAGFTRSILDALDHALRTA